MSNLMTDTTKLWPLDSLCGTARRYGIHIFDMMPTPVTAF